jgi:nucleotide-binding universal stress UspA family protein
MFKKVLFPTNFSDASTRALEYIKQLKGSGTEEVVVLTVIKYHYAFLLDEDSNLNLDDLDQWSVKEVQKRLEAVTQELTDNGFKVKGILVKGVVWNKILEVEQREKVCFIVIGSGGKNILKRLLGGSIPEVIIRRSKQPVFVVKKNDCGPATAQSKIFRGRN